MYVSEFTAGHYVADNNFSFSFAGLVTLPTFVQKGRILFCSQQLEHGIFLCARGFAAHLESPVCRTMVSRSFASDITLSKVSIPRCLLPGSALPAAFSNTVGLLHRVVSKDLEFTFGKDVNRDVVSFNRLEAKYAWSLSNPEVAKIAVKLVRSPGEIGIQSAVDIGRGIARSIITESNYWVS